MALSKGCTVALIVVAALIVIIILGVVFLGPKLLEKGVEVLIDKTETEIIANIPDGYTPDMVREIMADLKLAVKNDQLSGPQIQDMANTFQLAMEDQMLDQEESEKLLIKIQEALGQDPPVFDEIPEEMPDTPEAVPDSA